MLDNLDIAFSLKVCVQPPSPSLTDGDSFEQSCFLLQISILQ